MAAEVAKPATARSTPARCAVTSGSTSPNSKRVTGCLSP